MLKTIIYFQTRFVLDIGNRVPVLAGKSNDHFRERRQNI